MIDQTKSSVLGNVMKIIKYPVCQDNCKLCYFAFHLHMKANLLFKHFCSSLPNKLVIKWCLDVGSVSVLTYKAVIPHGRLGFKSNPGHVLFLVASPADLLSLLLCLSIK